MSAAHPSPTVSSPPKSRPFGKPSRVARSSESSVDSAQFTRSTRADDERLPPPTIIRSSRTSSQKRMLTEKTSLLPPTGCPPSQGFAKYRTDVRQYAPAEKQGLAKLTSLSGFWGALAGVLISTGLTAFSVYSLVASAPATADLLTCVLGVLFGAISIFIEVLHLSAYVLVWAQLRPAHHVVLHGIICCLGLLPFTRHALTCAALFFAHIVPAALFYAARVRREPVHAPPKTAAAASSPDVEAAAGGF